MNYVSDAKRRQELADLQKLLGAITPPKLTPPRRVSPPRRHTPAEVEMARLRLLDATSHTRANHQWTEYGVGQGCAQCPTGSLFRNSPAHHLFLIQEEP
jgi:hypothetical protein